MSRTWVLDFARPDEWINPNVREHWSVTAAKTRTWRKATAVHARAAGIPPLAGAHILAEFCFGDSRRRDLDNLSLKACIDGIVDAGVIADDDYRHLIGPDRRLGPKVKGLARIRITITELPTERTAA